MLYQHASLPRSLCNTLSFCAPSWQVTLTEKDECYPVLSPFLRPCQVSLFCGALLSVIWSLSRICCLCSEWAPKGPFTAHMHAKAWVQVSRSKSPVWTHTPWLAMSLAAGYVWLDQKKNPREISKPFEQRCNFVVLVFRSHMPVRYRWSLRTHMQTHTRACS